MQNFTQKFSGTDHLLGRWSRAQAAIVRTLLVGIPCKLENRHAVQLQNC